MAEDPDPDGTETVAIVSCDILGHSTKDLSEQIRNVASINDIISAAIRRIPPEQVVWSSGGDGGHIVLRGSDDWQANAIRLAGELLTWARTEEVALRITGHVGQVKTIWGADGRTQVVGLGINFAGWLLRQLHHEAVVVSEAFREAVAPAQLEVEVRFHDERLFLDRHGKPQLLYLMALDGVESTWLEVARDDHAGLELSLGKVATKDTPAVPPNEWDTVYFAKRIWQVTSHDQQVTNALEKVVGRLTSAAGSERSFLASMDRRELSEFVRIGQLIERKPGEIICRYGDPGESMFVILRGEVGVYNIENEGFGGQATPQHLNRPGDVVGELASVLNRNRTADLVAMTEVALLAFNYDEVKKSLPATATTAFDRFVVERVLEHVTQAASYLAGSHRAGPLSTGTKDERAYLGLEEVWREALLTLREHAQLITIGSGPLDLSFDHAAPATGDRTGLYVLASGSVQSPAAAEPDLHGEQCPALFIDLPNLLTRKDVTYERTAEPIKIFRIEAEGIAELALFQRQQLRTALRDAAGSVPDRWGYHAYLCHAGADKEVVRQIRDRLHARGIRCWFDEVDLLVGDSARERMERGLRSSRYLLVCASGPLLSSSWANQEIDAVLRYDVEDPAKPKILVLKLNQADSVDDAIPLLLQGKKWLEYRQPGHFDELIGVLKAPGLVEAGE